MSDIEYYSSGGESESESESDDSVNDEEFVGGAEELEEGEIEEDDGIPKEEEEGGIPKEDNEYEDEEDEQEDENEEYESADEEENDIELNEKQKVVTKKNKNIKHTNNSHLNFDEDDDDDDDNETYLQKFDSEITKNYINDFHPECFTHNYDEIVKLATVVRNNDNIVIDPNHKTIPFLTKYEKARILGQRAKQIETGAKPFVKVPENIIDGYIIAELELREKKIPFIIKRPLPSGACEYWNIRDLEIVGF
jgi:DNA-directed RNA polymerase I, II, and III subunit RPABC2